MRLLLPPPHGDIGAEPPTERLGRWLTNWLQEDVQVSFAASYARLEEAILGDRVELAWAPPIVCTRVRHWVRRILTAVRDGVGCGQSALLVRIDDPILELADLEGRHAAWVDPLSLSGYLSARATLAAAGFRSTRFFKTERFLGTYRDAVIAVASDEADVCSIYGRVGESDSDVISGAVDIAGLRALELRVLTRTAPFPYDALVFTRALDWSRIDPLAERLLAHRRGDGPSTLLEACNADGFAPTDPEAYDALAPLLDLKGR